MKEIKNMMFTGFLLINILVIYNAAEINKEIEQIEKELNLIEQLSKIEQIKSIDHEIKNANDAKRINDSDSDHNASTTSTKVNKKMSINSDLHVLGVLKAARITAETCKITGNTHIGRVLKANAISTEKLIVQTLVTERIISPTGVITIQGDLIINNDVMADSVSMRASSFIVENVKQWGLTHHDDFESEKSLDGWSDKRTSRCKEGGNTMLGGHCNFSYNEVNKVFKNLPEHTKLKINAAYHMLDSWDGETAYMKVNDEIVWSRKGQHSEKGINLCGGDYNDPAFNMY